MHAADYMTLATSVVAVAAIVLAAMEKLPFVKNNKKLLAWVQEADAFAGQMRLILPPGSTLAQAETLAQTKAAEIAQKYPKEVSQAKAVEQMLGTLGTIVNDGHILPPSVQPAATEFQAILAKLEALTDSLQAQAAPAAPAPAAPVVAS